MEYHRIDSYLTDILVPEGLVMQGGPPLHRFTTTASTKLDAYVEATAWEQAM